MITPSRKRRAFTLAELLLVMVILAILAGVAVPVYIKQAKESRIKATHANISNLGAALDLFASNCDRYPTTAEGLDALMQQPNNAKDWKGPYLKDGVPVDPWGNAFIYHSPGQHNTDTYDLSSNGPDEQEGTDDDIVNWKQ